MSSLNFRTNYVPMEPNAAGTLVRKISEKAKLIRMVLANMLWENQFYVDGKSSAEVIKELVAKVDPDFTKELAIKARTEYKLRHIPLLLARELARRGELQGKDLAAVIQRPDEMGEFLAIYKQDGKAIPNQVKLGLAMAFKKFTEYQLAKWDKNSAAFSLRDVMFLTHPKPNSAEQEKLFSRIANKELKTPDTWETQLSAGADKKETFERLMRENNLGALAFLRNLRNMLQAGISTSTIRDYAATLNVEKVLPFRFIAAARIVPELEDMLEAMMFKACAGMEKLKGKTVLLVDVSGSMYDTKVSEKSDLDRFDAAAALAVLCREICEEVEVYSFADNVRRILPRRGFALIEAIKNSQTGGTQLGKAVHTIRNNVKDYSRFIVFTDEASYDPVGSPGCKNAYVLNVASYKNGINNSEWTTISGFSEASLDYIRLYESIDIF